MMARLPYFWFPVSFLGVLCTVIVPSHASAIDFAIDVPPTSSISNLGEEGDWGEQDMSGMAEDDTPLRQEQRTVPAQVPPQKKEPKASSKVAFPQMACLANNVKFWQKIYAEVSEEEMLIHDKEDLSIIYAKVSVPSQQESLMRKSIMRSWRNRFEEIFASAAAALEQGRPLSVEEERVVRVLPRRKRNAAWLQSAKNTLRFQSGMMGRFYSGIERSLQHIPVIHPILQAQGLPGDLVHLPHVESSYVTFARSKVGAVGLWQIMPGTMRLLMGANYVNRRQDVRISTTAAAKLLWQNYNATQSWPLALTAYNHGLNGVLRAVRTTGSKDLCTIIDRYESASFRFASSNFYAQFLAARNLALEHYKILARKRGGSGILKEVMARHAKEGSS